MKKNPAKPKIIFKRAKQYVEEYKKQVRLRFITQLLPLLCSELNCYHQQLNSQLNCYLYYGPNVTTNRYDYATVKLGTQLLPLLQSELNCYHQQALPEHVHGCFPDNTVVTLHFNRWPHTFEVKVQACSHDNIIEMHELE
ncbi:hypothetical protein DM860_007251 [Cuscuta australis]|uniref:Uncharacterized protein n=1 Tax=Cuscuta australis TaxID=267555 RepID=A0A328E2Z6_9ASTE|nr:hypothetical protein DM860_007251 [Cuscuta australis]